MSRPDLHASLAQTKASLHRADDASTGEPGMQAHVAQDFYSVIPLVIWSVVMFTLHLITWVFALLSVDRAVNLCITVQHRGGRTIIHEYRSCYSPFLHVLLHTILVCTHWLSASANNPPLTTVGQVFPNLHVE